jgi:hypothetical protein
MVGHTAPVILSAAKDPSRGGMRSLRSLALPQDDRSGAAGT